MSAKVHPTAVVHSSAQLEEGVEIGPYAVIGEETALGPGTTVGAHAIVEFAVLGAHNRVFPGAFVGTAPQDLKYAGEKTRLVMGDRNTVRECVTLNRGTNATGETRIGSGCLFMAYSHVAHDCRIGDGVILANGTALAGHIEIGDRAVISGLVGMHQFIRVGTLAMVGGGSMVALDILPYCVAQGDRAVLRGINLLGLKRAGLDLKAATAVKTAYKTLFFAGLSLEAALEEIKMGGTTPEVRTMLQFIETSKRGIARPPAGAAEKEEAGVF